MEAMVLRTARCSSSDCERARGWATCVGSGPECVLRFSRGRPGSMAPHERAPTSNALDRTNFRVSCDGGG